MEAAAELKKILPPLLSKENPWYNKAKKKEGEAMLPQDPIMLLSYLNTQLRDNYSSLETLCADLEVDQKEIEAKMEAITYVYDKGLNQFI